MHVIDKNEASLKAVFKLKGKINLYDLLQEHYARIHQNVEYEYTLTQQFHFMDNVSQMYYQNQVKIYVKKFLTEVLHRKTGDNLNIHE